MKVRVVIIMNNDKKEFVKLGMNASLHFLVLTNDVEEAKELVRTVGGYNSFDPVKVCNAIDKIGGQVESFEIGREYSPVIYVNIPFWSNQSIGHKQGDKGEKLTTDYRKHLFNKVKAAMFEAEADECWGKYPTGGRSADNTVRAWWD